MAILLIASNVDLLQYGYRQVRSKSRIERAPKQRQFKPQKQNRTLANLDSTILSKRNVIDKIEILSYLRATLFQSKLILSKNNYLISLL